MEEEYARCQKEMEAEVREAKEELARTKGDCKEKYSKLESAIDEELELSLPSPPKKDVKPEEQEKTVEESPKHELGKDMWKQLTRVSIPVFSGDKRSYGSWKAAFMACVDKAPATAEYKLLQLKKYLSGEALAAVESLGNSAEAYEAAKSRLERKFGGQRRQINLHLEELDQFRPIRPGNAKDLDRLADLLDVIVINLKEAGRKEELGNGSLYMKVQKKMTTSTMLANYNRWVFEQKKVECVETLREWIIQEAEFQTVAAETLCGLIGKRRDSSHTFFGRPSGSGKPLSTNCPLCKRDHPVWSCQEFKKMDLQSRWQKAKQLRLCYRCLGRNHKGGRCAQNSRCGIDGCQKTHNRALHGDQFVNGGIVSESQLIEPERSLPLDMGASENNSLGSGTEGEQSSAS